MGSFSKSSYFILVIEPEHALARVELRVQEESTNPMVPECQKNQCFCVEIVAEGDRGSLTFVSHYS